MSTATGGGSLGRLPSAEAFGGSDPRFDFDGSGSVDSPFFLFTGGVSASRSGSNRGRRAWRSSR